MIKLKKLKYPASNLEAELMTNEELATMLLTIGNKSVVGKYRVLKEAAARLKRTSS